MLWRVNCKGSGVGFEENKLMDGKTLATVGAVGPLARSGAGRGLGGGKASAGGS